jgi:hypothetical protein
MKHLLCMAFAAVLLVLAGCNSRTEPPLSMRVVVLKATDLPELGKWNDLLNRPLIELEYRTPSTTFSGGRTLYLYDGRSGECKTVIEAPTRPGNPMLIGWAPCI